MNLSKHLKLIQHSRLTGLVALAVVYCPLALAAITFKGVAKDKQQAIQKEVPEAFNGRWSMQSVDKIITILMLSDLYEHARVYRQSGRDLIVEATPLSKIRNITFSGSQVFTEREIMIALGLKADMKFDREKVVTAGERLKNKYGSMGYFSTKVEVEFKPADSQTMDIHFSLSEGVQCEIQRISINGENPKLINNLNKSLDRFIGDPLSNQTLEGIQRRIDDFFTGKRYLQVQLAEDEISYNSDKTKATLKYTLNNPYRFEFIFYGNDSFSTSELLRALKIDEINREGDDPTTKIIQNLKAYYLAEGFAHVQISYTINDEQKDFVKQLKIDINEGPKVRIREIEVSGRISRPSKFYENFVKKNSTSLVRTGYYNRNDLDLGYKNLITSLHNEGYVRAKVQSARIEYEQKKSVVKVLLVIDEGPLTQVRKISFVGNENFSREILLNEITLSPNAPLRLNELDASIQMIQQFYQNQGYLEANITNKTTDLVSYNDTGSLANVKFEIYEGPKIYVSSIVIEGNGFTKDYVILRNLSFDAGDLLLPDKIRESISRINRLGIFAQTDIRTIEAGTMVSQRTVLITVVERNPGLFRFGVGVLSRGESDLTVRGFTGVSYSNINGTARAITGRVDIATNIQRENKYPENDIIVGYLEPFLFGSLYRGRLNLSRTQDARDHTDKYAQITESNEIDVFIERDLSERVKFTWTLWNLDSSRVFQNPDPPPVVYEPSVFQVVTIGPSIDVDFRDNPFLPTKGFLTRLSLDYSDPSLGGSENIQFFKGEASHTGYLRLGSPRFIWANSVRGGYLENISPADGSGVPLKYSFFLGGASTIRAFSGRDYDNRIPYPSQFSDFDERTLVKTNSNYYLLKSELRFPIYGMFGGVVFYDAGQVNVADSDFTQIGALRQAVGFGFRFNTPVGPVSLDLGYEVNPPDDLEPQKSFHFSIGTF